jgi:hypothetical protein
MDRAGSKADLSDRFMLTGKQPISDDVTESPVGTPRTRHMWRPYAAKDGHLLIAL